MTGPDRDPGVLDRAALLRRGAGAAVALARLRVVQRAGAAVDPRLAALQRHVKGPVLVPPTAAYEGARLVYQERFDGVHPLGVVQPLSPADVRQVVAWAKRTGVRLRIRSGGHSYGGYSTGAGLVVDLRRLNGLHLDEASGLVTVGAGSRLIDVEAYLAGFGRAIPSGSCATVGIGGLALGGGVGFASRKLGTTSDNVVALGIVTADGRYRRCNARENADLFWACRGGGGGNFGLVTHFELRSHPVGDVSTFSIGWPWSQAGDVLAAWQALAPHAPDEFFSICSFATSASGQSVECFGQYLGPPSALTSLLRPLTNLGGAAPRIQSSSYLDAQLRWAGCLGKTIAECHLAGQSPAGTLPRDNFLAKSDYVNAPLTAAGRATVVRFMEQPPSSGSGALIFDSYGGALNRPAADATAFVHRNALFSGQYLVHWASPAAEPAARTWLRGFHTAMRPHVSGFAYQNYIDPELTTWRHAYYGANYPRLVAIKERFDPGRLFEFAQAIGS